MYEVFDSYLNVGTWHTSHDLDRNRFLRALGSVVHNENFNPDTMGKYMREKKNVTDERRNEGYASKIDHDVRDAWAIVDFLRLDT